MSLPHSKKRSATTDSREGSYPSGGSNTPSSSRQRATKKTRFVDPDEDPTSFAEQVDSALEAPARKRSVKTEGYDSDSSNDGEGVVFSRRKGDAEDEDGEDDDMFAAAEKVSDKTGDARGDFGRGKKEEKYMRLGDIEGQEFGGEKSGDEDESESESDVPEDEDDEERRKKAGMGYELSSFNMREEMEEGKFTADGTYVRSYDPHGVHDRWMDGLSEREIKLARKRKKHQERIQKQRIEEEERELKESGGKSEMEKQLLPLLKKGETVLEALQRLGAQAKKQQSKEKRNPDPHDAMPVDTSNKPKPAPTNIEFITHLASNLMSLGDLDIYSKTYEEIVRDVRRSGTVDADWEPPSADLKYEYKWDVPGVRDDSQVFGPFSEEEMHSWFKASYFGPSGEKVKVRTVSGTWHDWDDIFG